MRKLIYALLIISAILLLMCGMTINANSDGSVRFSNPVEDSATEHSSSHSEEHEEPTAWNTEGMAETDHTTDEDFTTEPATETEPVTEPVTEPETETESAWIYMGNFKLTAYCSCQICCGEYALNRPVDENGKTIVYTASGARAEAGVTIAVDPRVIPYGTNVRINGNVYTAQDTGGGIKGNRIDVYFDDHQEALQFGLQSADVEILLQ